MKIGTKKTSITADKGTPGILLSGVFDFHHLGEKQT